MTLNEYAKRLANEVRENPKNLSLIAEKILNTKVNDKPITKTFLNQLLDLLEIELGDFTIALENYSNTAALSLMDKIRAEIIFHPDDLNNLQGSGNYFQAFNGGRIIIGKGSYIAKNVGIITVNHDVKNPDDHQEPKDVVLGESCWIGMNAMILPGVELGPHTVVGAGAVVTKSFPEGWCVIGGNPARKIKDISKDNIMEKELNDFFNQKKRNLICKE